MRIIIVRFFLACAISSSCSARSYNNEYNTALFFRRILPSRTSLSSSSITAVIPWTVNSSPRGGSDDTDDGTNETLIGEQQDDGETTITTTAASTILKYLNVKEEENIVNDDDDDGGEDDDAIAQLKNLTSPRGGAFIRSSSGIHATRTAFFDPTMMSPSFSSSSAIYASSTDRKLIITGNAVNRLSNTDIIDTTVSESDKEQQPQLNSKQQQQQQQQQRRPLKILFLSSDTGGGHRASAEALAAQFCHHYPNTTYDLLDCWTDIPSSWPYYTIKDTYKSFSSTPWKWRALYHVSNTAVYTKLADAHSYYMTQESVRCAMERYNPDVVVSVHPTMNYVPLLAIRKVSKMSGKDIPFFTVVTDFGSGHCHWFNKDVDKMYLASEPIKQIAQKHRGVPDDKIAMIGLPIRRDFAVQSNAMGGDRTTNIGIAHRKNVRSSLGIINDDNDPSRRMILVMGGGEGVGSLSDIVNELYAKLRTQGVNATICVICGRNVILKKDLETRNWDKVVSQSLRSYETLRSRFYTKVLTMGVHRSRRIQLALDRAAAKAMEGREVAERPGDVKVVSLGFVTNMAEYMVAADVLVSKAGPGTIAEAAAIGLPIMVTSYLPGQEAGNVDIVLNGGFGDYCEDPETIALEIACWLQEPNLLEKMSRKAMRVGYPNAAEEIALDIGKMTLQWMERNEQKHIDGT